MSETKEEDHLTQDLEITCLDGWMTESFKPFTTPWHAANLNLKNRKLVAALLDGKPAGLAVSSFSHYSAENDNSAEIVDEAHKAGVYFSLDSLFVHSPYRRRGLGDKLLKKLEEEAIRLGGTRIGTSFLTSTKARLALEGLLNDQDWVKSPITTKLVQLSPSGLVHLVKNIPDRKLPADVDFFTWKDRIPEDDSRLIDLKAEHNISMGLHPDGEEHMPIDEDLSVGFRIDGELSGWMIVHAYTRKIRRYSSLWTKPDLKRKGMGIRAVMESLRRHRKIMHKVDQAFFTVANENDDMQRFMKRRILGGEDTVSGMIHYSKSIKS